MLFLRRIAFVAEPVFATRERELRRAEAGDEVSAANPADLFHGLEHRIERAKTGDVVVGSETTRDALAGEHSVALQKRRGEGLQALGGRP